MRETRSRTSFVPAPRPRLAHSRPAPVCLIPACHACPPGSLQPACAIFAFPPNTPTPPPCPQHCVLLFVATQSQSQRHGVVDDIRDVHVDVDATPM